MGRRNEATKATIVSGGILFVGAKLAVFVQSSVTSVPRPEGADELIASIVEAGPAQPGESEASSWTDMVVRV
jgi:hypothetical protein